MLIVKNEVVIINVAKVEMVTDLDNYIQLHFGSGKSRGLDISYDKFLNERINTPVNELIVNAWTYINLGKVEYVELKGERLEFYFDSGMNHGFQFINGGAAGSFNELVSYGKSRLEIETRY